MGDLCGMWGDFRENVASERIIQIDDVFIRAG